MSSSVGRKKNMTSRTLGAVALGVGMGFLLGCNAGPNRTNIELIQDMMDQVSVKAQDYDPSQEDGLAMRIPPEGTVPIGFTPYPFRGQPLEAERSLKNPLIGDYSPELMDLGQRNYQIFCGICHGNQGLGDGSVASKMAVRPPSLVSDRVKDMGDGRIYHIMVDGQGVMGSYASQIRDEQARWAIVNYIRGLQRKSEGQGE